ncbi:MAG: Gfo/Idh/MocA family oxidoreductase [Nitrospiraceae bacterium]|nr:Gfo/Idh/MocA family oxidoreductase [Nitrospiraceae bacterium]
MKKTIRRRTFLGQTAAAAGLFTIVPRHAVAGSGETPPSEKLNVAGIGAGGQAAHDLDKVSRYSNIVALCDVDEKQARESFERWPDAAKYKDYRVMLDKQKDIDAVVVATPDHIHAPAAIAAMELGKHVYVEKPMAHNIYEVRRMMEVARRTKVATQMGNQGHSFYGCRVLRTWIEAGVAGKVREIHSWTNRPTWPQGIDRPADTPPVPPTLDWNLWLGPAPERPYHPAYVPRNWRGWCDFGTGALGDMACHIMDGPFWSLDLGFPTRVEAEVSGPSIESYPKWSIIRYEFPKRGKMPPLTYTWYDGGKMPERPDELEEERRMGDSDGGSLLIGDKATIMTGTYGGGVRVIPETKMKALKRPKVKYPRSPGQHEEWIEACKGGKPAGSNFEYAGQLTEMVLLGVLALRTGGVIEWDAKNMKATGLPEADPFIRREHREGWRV